jgi:hypothetical protein
MFWQHKTNTMQKGGMSVGEKKTTEEIPRKCVVCNKGLNKYHAIKAKVQVEVQFHTLSPSALDRGQC